MKRFLCTLGLAVALEQGLIVPVVHRADELNLLGLARRGTRVTVALPDERALEVVRGVYRRLGVEDRLRLLHLGPDEIYELNRLTSWSTGILSTPIS